MMGERGEGGEVVTAGGDAAAGAGVDDERMGRVLTGDPADETRLSGPDAGCGGA